MSDPMSIKPIETVYRGYRFRSRLEARWGVFLDALGVQWEYEKEGFELPSGRYLPDFWIPLQGIFAGEHPKGSPPEKGFYLEIKPCKPTDHELLLCRELSVATRHVVYLACGTFDRGMSYKFHYAGFTSVDSFDYDNEESEYTPSGLLFYLCAEAVPEPHGYCFERIPGARVRAKSARFEFGETPDRFTPPFNS